MSLEGSTPLSQNPKGNTAVAISDVNDSSNILQYVKMSIKGMIKLGIIISILFNLVEHFINAVTNFLNYIRCYLAADFFIFWSIFNFDRSFILGNE